MPTWDEQKRRENLVRHGMDLADAERFEFDTALVEEDRDVRHEDRFRAIGWLDNRLCFLVYIPHEDGEDFHALSLRPAEPRERRRYAEEA